MGTPESGYKARCDLLVEEIHEQMQQWAAVQAHANPGQRAEITYDFKGKATCTVPKPDADNEGEKKGESGTD